MFLTFTDLPFIEDREFVELIPVPQNQLAIADEDEPMPALEQVQLPPQDPDRPPLNQPNQAQEARDLAAANILNQNPPSSGDSGVYSPASTTP